MVAGGAAARYAAALLRAARERDRVAAVEEDLRRVSEALAAAPVLRRVLAHPGLPREAKADILAAVFGPHVGAVTMGLLRLAVRKGRAALLPAVMDAALALAERERGVVPVAVTAAAPLDPERQTALEQALARTAGRSLRVAYRVDPDLLGGLVIRAGGRVIDASLRGRLNRLRRRLQTLNG